MTFSKNISALYPSECFSPFFHAWSKEDVKRMMGHASSVVMVSKVLVSTSRWQNRN